MLALRDPREAYRRVDIDARVEGSTPAELVNLCYDQFIVALGSALQAAERDDNSGKSRWLTRALSALFALEMGVSQDAPMGRALLQLYHAARSEVLDSVTAFNAERLRTVRQDFVDIAQAMRNAAD